MPIKRNRWITIREKLPEVLPGAPLVHYDALKQIALEPKRDIHFIWPDEGKSKGVEGLFSELQKMLGEDNRTVRRNPFYWTETKQPTFKEKFIRFIKDPFGIKNRRFLKQLQKLKPGPYEDYIDYWY